MSFFYVDDVLIAGGRDDVKILVKKLKQEMRSRRSSSYLIITITLTSEGKDQIHNQILNPIHKIDERIRKYNF